MAEEATKKGGGDALRQNERKWTKSVMDAGWNGFPSVIIERQKALGLDPTDMNIILHLTNYWWQADNLPHPSVATIADALGMKPRAIQKRLTRLHAAGLVTRIERRKTRYGSDTNEYDFSGLIAAITPFAEEKLAVRAKREKEERARLARKKPHLVVVEGDQGGGKN